MAHRTTLVRTAIAGTAALWTATIVTAVTELGSERLHETFRAGAVLAALTTIAILGATFVKRQVDRIHVDLSNVVNEAADEIHAAVGETGQILRMDRDVVEVARQLLAAQLVTSKLPRRHNQAA